MAEKKKILLLIDANSLIHRAFHALPPLSTSKGEMVNAVYGFLLAFFKAIKEFHPDYMAAAFDVAAPTLRHVKYKEYKAKRVAAPDELYDQMPQVKKALRAFHVPFYEKEGFEADDIIGTMSLQAPRKQAHPQLETIILSGDADVFQLLDEHTKAYTLRKGIQDSVLYDQRAVEKRFGGLRPGQLIDYKALRGDPSDNIPGVTGIGEKTAILLLMQFGSLEQLYKELESKSERARALKPRLQAMLLQYKDQAFVSKELASIERNAPIEFRLQDLEWKGFDPQEAQDMLKEFEFRTLIPKVFELTNATPAAQEPSRDLQERIDQLYRDGIFSAAIYDTEKRLMPVLRAMETMGIAIDMAYFTRLAEDIGSELLKLEGRIQQAAGIVFNINSPKQLSQVLFETLALSPKGLHKTPGGVVSTASEELEKLASLHPLIPDVLRYRELAKLQNTYVLPLPQLADKQGRIHTHFDQLGAATGRMSSSNPNVQNIPLQGEWQKKIRRGFVAERGHRFLSFDYSQIELRVVAFLAGEEKMQGVFQENKDIHRMTAAEVFGVQLERVTDAMRYRAKALNFGILYGMGAKGFAQSAKVSYEEAEDFIASYFARFPRIQQYIEETKEFAREHGYVETMFGRKRYIPDILSHTQQIRAAAERAAVNHPVQGCAADIIKMAMVRIAETLLPEHQDWRLLLQIHDELLFEMPDDILDEHVRSIQHAMEEVCNLGNVPLVVSIKTGTNWDALVPFAP